MPKIFISYRRSDSQAMAGRIHDRLAKDYGDDPVFLDTLDIPPGKDVPDYLMKKIDRAALLLAIVGRKWQGKRRRGSRITDEGDCVRAELEAAMKRKIPIIPVLVDEAAMPKPGELPDAIKDFSRLNALQVCAGQDFHLHMDRLIRKTNVILGKYRTVAYTPSPTPEFGKWLNSLAVQVLRLASKNPTLSVVRGRHAT